MQHNTSKQNTSVLEGENAKVTEKLCGEACTEWEQIYILYAAEVVSSYAIIMYVCFSEY